MEDTSGGQEKLERDDLALTEEFDCEEDEIMTNTISNSASTLASEKLKELDDILQDYSNFDEVQLKNGIGDSITEVKEGKSSAPESEIVTDETSPPSHDTDLTDCNGHNRHRISSDAEVQISTVRRRTSLTDDEISSQEDNTPYSRVGDSGIHSNTNTSDSNELGTSVLIFPNGESYSLTDSKSHHRIVQMCQDIFKSENKVNNSETEQQIAAKDQKISELEDQSKDLLNKNHHLNGKLQHLLQELARSQETLKAHSASARTAITRMQKDSDQQIKSLKVKCLAMQKDKESAVMDYARREKELLDAKRLAESADKKSKEAIREKEKAIAQMKGMKIDLFKMKSVIERHENENGQIKKETEKWKEEANSHVIKVKWAQNKLKSETDLHNETKEKLAKAVLEIRHAKEETEQIRKNCQGMIKTYQESEEMRSNSLDSQLKEKEMLLSQQEAKSGELEGIHKQQVEELRRLKQQYKDVMEENVVIKTRVECLEKERLKNEETLKSYTEILNRQKREAMILSEKLKDLDLSKTHVEEKQEEIMRMQETLEEERAANEEMKLDEMAWKKKQQELLEFTQRVSTINAELTSGNEILTSKLKTTSKDLEESRALSSGLEKELKTLKSEMHTRSQNAEEVTSALSKRLEDKETSVNHLTTQLEELKDDIRTLKRKNNAGIKDLTRQLQQARKKLEPYESASYPAGSAPTTEDGSMGSRASSDTSLDCVGKTNNTTVLSHNSAAESGSLSSHLNGTDVPETVVATSGEISTQTLIERIVRLQRIHARKNEKIDFLHDHVQQLVDEMQKKNKIIHHYMLREESGMMMPMSALNQASAAEHGSKLSRHVTEEVNRKMQSVLEDTLLKNIALKESVDALGSEIARISSAKRS